MLRYLVVHAVLVLVLGTTISSQALAAQSPEDNDLCPVAGDRSNRSVNYQNHLIKAPVSAEEKAVLMATLPGPEGESRTIAIVRLAPQKASLKSNSRTKPWKIVAYGNAVKRFVILSGRILKVPWID